MNILKAEILQRQTPRFWLNSPVELIKETVTVFLKGSPEDFRYSVTVSEWLKASKIKEDTLFFHEVALAEHRFEQEVLSKLLKGYNFAENGTAVDIDMGTIECSTNTSQQGSESAEHRKLLI
jgi:hypothetical protein